MKMTVPPKWAISLFLLVQNMGMDAIFAQFEDENSMPGLNRSY